jgi:hypothetical protein
MEVLDKVLDDILEKLKEWADRVIEALFGPEAQPQAEPIPVPADNRVRR